MTPAAVLSFWFSELSPHQWWSRDPDVDAAVASRFAGTHLKAARCELYGWRGDALGRLAEIILLDQFSRHLFREDRRAFDHDPLALALAQEAVSGGADRALPPERRAFLFLPFMHSESLVIHELSVRLHSQPGMERRLYWELKHKAIIERFGRYPQRNRALGRTSTPAEESFLSEPGAGF